MFIIRCENCGRTQLWGEGVTLGIATEIEIAGRAIFCTCGVCVEEDNGSLHEFQSSDERPIN